MSTWGPWYSVIKSIKGHRYRYDQRTRRVGKSILTQNIYRGRADGGSGGRRPAVATTSAVGDGGTVSVAEAIDKVLSYIEADRFTLENMHELRSALRRGVSRTRLIEALQRIRAASSERFVQEHLDLVIGGVLRGAGGIGNTVDCRIEKWWAEEQSADRAARVGVSVTTTPTGSRTPLVTDGEEDFVQELMTGEADKAFEPGYRWDLKARGKGPALTDPDVLSIGVRMGVAMVSQIWRDRTTPNCPVYNNREDRISIPDPARYRDVDGCSAERNLYVDTLHELVHATMRRLGRQKPTSRQAYYREELVAELGANLVARRLGVEPESTSRSMAYLQAYREGLDDQDGDVEWAIAKARQAADYLIGFHPRGGWQRVATTLPANGSGDSTAAAGDGKLQS